MIKENKENENDTITANVSLPEGYQCLPAVKRIADVTTKQQLMTAQQQTALSPHTNQDTISLIGLKRDQPNKFHADHPTFQVSMTLKQFFKANTMVDFWDENKSGKDQGYQRAVSMQRARAFGDYTQAGNPSFSNYIFSIRDVDEGKVKFTEHKDGTVTIEIEKGCPIWIVDGSHRATGLDETNSESPGFDDLTLNNYQMPVSLTIGQSKEEEVEQFITENRMHKGVGTDLAFRCLNEMTDDAATLKARKSGIYKDVDFVKSAYPVVDIMNQRKDSQFNDRLRKPNIKPKAAPNATISEKGFADAINPLMGTSNSSMYYDSSADIAEVLIKWWNAWEEICPKPFQRGIGQNPNDFVIQQNIGTQSLNKLLSKLPQLGLSIKKLSKDQFVSLIDIDELRDPTNWMKGMGKWSLFGTNQKSFGQIAKRMLDMIVSEKSKVITVELGGTIPQKLK